MKKGLLRMKKALLTSIFLLFSSLMVFAYETVIIKYPAEEMWQKAYYKKIGDEAILQYVPKGQSKENWKRTIVAHSYYQSGYPIRVFIANELLKMMKMNPTAQYKYLKLTDIDVIAGRCTNDFKNIPAQCEFFRATRAHSGIITLHYINRDKEDFMENYHQWYDIIKKAKYMNSYYRGDRIFNKAEFFELW